MRRCTSHTGSSPLWYSTSSTPNSVVPSPKRAMLAREWRSTASNARASTIHSLRGLGEGGDGFISLQEPWPQGKCSHIGRDRISRFRSKLPRLCRRCQMLADLGLLALRLTLGAVFLAHGAQKSVGAFGGPGFAGATGFIESIGFRPARVWTALAVGGELAAGLLFVLGLWTPLAGLLVLATMAGAVGQGAWAQGVFQPHSGGAGATMGRSSPPPRGGGGA